LEAFEQGLLQLDKGLRRVAGLAFNLLLFERTPMSLQAPFFGKRPADSVTPRPSSGQPVGLSGASANSGGNNPLAQAPATAPAPAPATPTASTTVSALSGVPAKEGGSQLTVGPNIKLKGVEITDCDTLVVEGTVEATMDSRVMHITEIGAFKGSAEIDYAEIHGEFSGDLTVREKLVIYSTGRVSGKIRYGKVVIQEGGQLIGDIQFGAAAEARNLQSAKVGLLTVA
jgi:cytoskeletal protein CcmA (bactofilin family)